jgi:hypothetical protein
MRQDGPHDALPVTVASRVRAPELDAAAAEALALVTLLTAASPSDLNCASAIVDEALAAPEGTQRLINGLSSVAATLLVLLEFHGGLGLHDALGEVGRLVAQASLPE